MEAIQEKLNSMVYNTWIIQSAVCLTNTILDQGNSPAVLRWLYGPKMNYSRVVNVAPP